MNLTPEDRLASPLNLEELLLTTKQLEPLSEDAIVRLQKVQQLDVTDFNEAEVRSNIIDPIVRVFGVRERHELLCKLGTSAKYSRKKTHSRLQLDLMGREFLADRSQASSHR
jgi:hypothetical protein